MSVLKVKNKREAMRYAKKLEEKPLDLEAEIKRIKKKQREQDTRIDNIVARLIKLELQ